ncbi:TRAP transporter substrate-binding protein [Propylenella binzhouense]|uniref:TRAP transporter substrate-binding protein n=1 Tax=Propylenella binzhouense TaxID=2555902 RepID=A0A964WTF8_9HYPH|nr:TRAP transporter substrate-binding protein [Propylenella binzhouense]MYZ47931.1 TRAP transporter substrate-binding protein [Propylenella binzhouense]
MRLTLRLAGIVLAAGFFSPALAQTELKFGHVGEPGSLFEASANKFAEIANAKLGDKAKVVVYGSSQLGGDDELLQKLKLGTVDFALPSTVMSSVVPAFGVFEMPYLVKDRDHMKRIEQEIVWPTLAPAAEEKGYKILAVWENGFRQITNNKHPINTPEDLQGIKLRVPKGVWRVKMFQSYGANPTPMAFSEVFVALQTGVIDGQENPLAQIASAKFQEVQKYLSMTGHVYTPAYVVVGKNKFGKLDADVQKALEDAARETQAFVYEKAAELDRDLAKVIEDAGVKVNEVDKDAFIKASQPVYDEFAKEVSGGKDLIDKALALGKSS